MKPILYGTNGRCALDLSTLNVPVTKEEALKILKKRGFKSIESNIGNLSRQRLDGTKYKRHARQDQAPKLVDCRTFIIWLYAETGILLSTAALFESGCPINRSFMRMGDIILITDKTAPSGRHVGMAYDDNHVIHAQKGMNIAFQKFDQFLGSEKIIKIVRLTNMESLATFECPSRKGITCSTDLELIIRKAYNHKNKTN